MTRDMTRETLAMTREDSDSRLMTRDSTRDSAPGKSKDSRLDSRLDSHESCTALPATKAAIFVQTCRHRYSGTMTYDRLPDLRFDDSLCNFTILSYVEGHVMTAAGQSLDRKFRTSPDIRLVGYPRMPSRREPIQLRRRRRRRRRR